MNFVALTGAYAGIVVFKDVLVDRQPSASVCKDVVVCGDWEESRDNPQSIYDCFPDIIWQDVSAEAIEDMNDIAAAAFEKLGIDPDDEDASFVSVPREHVDDIRTVLPGKITRHKWGEVERDFILYDGYGEIAAMFGIAPDGSEDPEAFNRLFMRTSSEPIELGGYVYRLSKDFIVIQPDVFA